MSADEQAQRLAEERERALLGWRVTMGAARREGWDEGRAEGRAVLRSVLVRQATQRFGPLDEPTRARIEGATEAELVRWLDELLEAPHLQALFEEARG